MCKHIHVLNLCNERADLILKIDNSNEHWSTVLQIKGEKLYNYYSENFNKAECNYRIMKKEILAIKGGIKKFLIFLAPIHFLIQTYCKVIFSFF